MKSADMSSYGSDRRQVEFSLAEHNSSCLFVMHIYSKNHLLSGLNSTLKELTKFVNPLNIEFSCQCGI